MSIDRMIRIAMDDVMSEHYALCLLKDHQDLKEMHKEFDLEHKKFWDSFEALLVKKGIITQKEKNSDISLYIKDGVVFKKERKS